MGMYIKDFAKPSLSQALPDAKTARIMEITSACAESVSYACQQTLDL